MARQGWLMPVRLPEGAGYRLTPRAVARLREAADRIYRRDLPAWDGRWHVVVLERVTERAARLRLRSGLGYLGYACVDGSTWISPRPSVELDALLAAERLTADSFLASYDGDARGLAARAWDLDGLAAGYRQWLVRARQIVTPSRERRGRSGVRDAERTRARVAQVLVRRSWPARRAAARSAGQARRRPGSSTPRPSGSCPLPPASWTVVWPARARPASPLGPTTGRR